MLTTCSKKTTADGEAIGLEIERAVNRRRFERSKVGLFDLESTDKENLIGCLRRLQQVSELKMEDIDSGRDDFG